MSLSFLLLFLSHLILSAWAQGEKRLAPRGQSGPVAGDRNPGGASSSRSSGSIASSASSTSSSVSSSSSSSSAASPGTQGSGLEHSSFQWSPSGRRTGSLYCRVGIGFHLQIYPDGKVNGSHEANMLSKLLALLQKPFETGGRLEIREGQRVIRDPRPRPAYLAEPRPRRPSWPWR